MIGLFIFQRNYGTIRMCPKSTLLRNVHVVSIFIYSMWFTFFTFFCEYVCNEYNIMSYVMPCYNSNLIMQSNYIHYVKIRLANNKILQHTV